MQLKLVSNAAGKEACRADLGQVHVPVNYQSGSGKGYAYVQYKDPVAAQHSLRELDGKVFQGRLLHILPASSKRQAGIDDFTISTLPLKKQQHIRRRAEATSSTFNWNSMFMNVSESGSVDKPAVY